MIIKQEGGSGFVAPFLFYLTRIAALIRKEVFAMEKNSAIRREKNLDTLEWYESMVLGAALLVLLFTFVFRVAVVDGSSMNPTLLDGDRVLLRSIAYQPSRGDPVVIDAYISYGKPLCKRVIALGGDTVDIDFETGAVTVNGTELTEPYIKALTRQPEGVAFPIMVPEGCVFVMGDNRMNSKDSRSPDIGCIDERDLLGKIIFRITPIGSAGVVQ